jgi:hypothetical protein
LVRSNTSDALGTATFGLQDSFYSYTWAESTKQFLKARFTLAVLQSQTTKVHKKVESFMDTFMAYDNNLVAEVGRGPRFNVGEEEPRFGSGGARLQLMGYALHYVLP